MRAISDKAPQLVFKVLIHEEDSVWLAFTLSLDKRVYYDYGVQNGINSSVS